MKILPCGDKAVILDCQSLAEAQRWYGALAPIADAVLGAQTVLLRGEPQTLRSLIAGTTPDVQVARVDLPTLEIPTRYDGEDLAHVASCTGLTEAEVIAAHTGRAWIVAFGGFAPGFAYLTDGDPRLVVARRESPRTKVPAGAVGLAGEFSGVYPRESPGGWQLIGHTELPVWDADRNPPALLRAGGLVQFVAIP